MRISSDSMRRWSALIAFVLAVTALFSGYSLSWEYPTGSSPTMSAEDISRFIAANRGGLGLNIFLEGLTAILLVILAGLLGRQPTKALSDDGLGGRLLLAAAGLAAAVDLSVGLTTGVALVQFAPSSATTAIAALWMLNFADMVVLGFPLAFTFGVAAVVIWRTGVVPRWIAGVSLIACALEIVAALGTWITSLQGAPQLPLILTIWALFISGGLLLERRSERIGA